ncbi:MAG: SPOR domain-containing protein [Bacteroidetes bacterium]|nr:SPOR domain-containing protein [Bacteroidota bacterium]
MVFQVNYKLLVFSILMSFLSINISAQEATITLNEDLKIRQLLELKKSLEEENKLTDGYTIQLYYGEKNRANNVIRKYRYTHDSWSATIKYETPNYKVWVGNFSSRIDADRALIEIKKKFPSAFILKPERNK